MGQSAWSERDIDRVAALGGAARHTAIGTDILRWVVARDAFAAGRVRIAATEAVQKKFPDLMPEAYGIAVQAMQEYSARGCLTCEGRGKAKLANGVVLECERCHGSGVRKYSDSERRRGAGLSRGAGNRRLGPAIDWVLRLLADADQTVNREMNRELERC